MHEFSSQLSTLFFALSYTAEISYTNWLIFNWITSFFNRRSLIRFECCALGSMRFFLLHFYSGLDTKTVCYLFCFAFHDISIFPAELKNASDSFHATKQIENFSEFPHRTFLLSLDFSTTRSYDVCGKAWILSESRKIPLSQERKISLRSFASASHQQRINSFHFESKLTQFASRFHISFLAGCWERVEIHLVFLSIRPGLNILVTGELVLKMVWNETQISAICFPHHWTRTALACWLWCAGKWRENVNFYFIIMPMMLRCCCWWWYGRSLRKWHTKSRRKWRRAGCCRKFTRAFRLLSSSHYHIVLVLFSFLMHEKCASARYERDIFEY